MVPTIKTDLKTLDPAQDLVVWLCPLLLLRATGWHSDLGDPVFCANAAPIPGAVKAFEGTSIYGADDMPEIEALLIRHDHYDHLDFPTAQALKSKVKQVIVGLGVGEHFERWGHDMGTVREADWNEVVSLGSQVQVHVTPARHFSGCTFTRDQSLWAGFALASSERRLFFSGDSGSVRAFSGVDATVMEASAAQADELGRRPRPSSRHGTYDL